MNVTTWMQQAKEVTKKLSDMMYIPAEDANDPEFGHPAQAAKEDDSKSADERPITETRSPIEEDNELIANCEDSSTEERSSPSLEGESETPADLFKELKVGENAAAAMETAKKVASSFFTFAKEATFKAATTAEETAKKFQSAVVEKTIIGDLEKERAKFDDEVKQKELTPGTLPWIGLPDSYIVKKHILALSLDTRNFTRDPPTEVSFDFSRLQTIAAVLLKEDPNLQKVRYQLVPKQMNEERFWRNYFYRVSLVRQSALGDKVDDEAFISKEVEQVEKADVSKGQEKAENIGRQEQIEAETDNNESSAERNKRLKTIRDTVAEAAQSRNNEDMEKELLNDFNDYELVANNRDKSDEQWEKEIVDLLNSTDLA